MVTVRSVGGMLTLLVLAWVPARAQEEQIEKTAFTVSEPVEVPGAILPPGNYVIQLKASAPRSNLLQLLSVLQILSADEKKVYATAVSMPDYNAPPADKSLFSYYERGPGLPRALRAWWYPAPNHYGEHLFYPMDQARVIARDTKEGVLSLPPEMAAMLVPQARAPARKVLPGPLPKTAGNLLLLAGIGLLCILAALMLGAASMWIAARGITSRRKPSPNPCPARWIS